MTPSVNACDWQKRSILSLLARKELQSCFDLIWDPSKTSVAILQARNHVDPERAIQWLLEVMSIDPDSRDIRNQSALIYAVKAGFREAVTMLLERNECTLVMKKQSLIHAAEERDEEIVQLLLISLELSIQLSNYHNVFDAVSTEGRYQAAVSQDGAMSRSVFSPLDVGDRLLS